jgi:hypothetical protein
MKAAAGLLLGGALTLFAAQEAAAPKPLVRRDLLVPGSGEIAPPARDIFRPRTAAAPPPVRVPGKPAPKPAAPEPDPEAQPTFTLSLSYIGSIKSGGRTIALVLRGGQTLSVGEGDEIIPGYKAVWVTAEAIIIQGPGGERKSFKKQGDRP